MCKSTIPILLTILMSTAAAVTPGSKSPGCFDPLARDLHRGDAITVFTDDSSKITGGYLDLVTSPSVLLIRPPNQSAFAACIPIPCEKISRITYTRPSHSRWVLAAGGFAIGATAGALAFATLTPETENKGICDFSDIENGITEGVLGGIIGGALGLGIGLEIGNHFRTTVTLNYR